MRCPSAGPLASDQGHSNRHGGDDRGEVAGRWQGQEKRLVHTRHTLVGTRGCADYVLPAPLVPVGVFLTKSGQGAVDQADIPSGCIVAYPQSVGHAGPEILNEDIGPLDEFLHLFLALGRLQVQFNRPLAAVPGCEGRLTAGGITAGALNLDDVGALFGKQHPQQRAGDVLSELHDPDPSQCSLCLCGSISCAHVC